MIKKLRLITIARHCHPECGANCHPECGVNCHPECGANCHPECGANCHPECGDPAVILSAAKDLIFLTTAREPNANQGGYLI